MAINPSWRSDFKINKTALNGTQSQVAQDVAPFKTPPACNYIGWDSARADIIESELADLLAMPGEPYSGAGPGYCGLLSCSRSNAILLCNVVSCFNLVTPSSLSKYALIVHVRGQIPRWCSLALL